MSELKPCPFCGGNAKLITWTPTAASISCIMCGAHFNTYTEAEAIAAWNSRAERTCSIESSYLNDFASNHECWYEFEMQCGYQFRWDEMEPPTYCPNCGCKVIGG